MYLWTISRDQSSSCQNGFQIMVDQYHLRVSSRSEIILLWLMPNSSSYWSQSIEQQGSLSINPRTTLPPLGQIIFGRASTILMRPIGRLRLEFKKNIDPADLSTTSSYHAKTKIAISLHSLTPVVKCGLSAAVPALLQRILEHLVGGIHGYHLESLLQQHHGVDTGMNSLH